MLIADLENILVLVKCYRSLILAAPARKARQPLWPKLEAAAVAKIVDRHNAVSIVLDGNPAYSVNSVDGSEEIVDRHDVISIVLNGNSRVCKKSMSEGMALSAL